MHQRKQEIIRELEDVDKAIVEATSSLEDLKERMQRVLELPVPELTSSLNASSPGLAKPASAEEERMWRTIKATHPKMLFYIHQNKVESVIIFTLSSKADAPVESRFLVTFRDDDGRELSPTEESMYGVSIVPNHQRDFPHVTEMNTPVFLVDKTRGGDPSQGVLIAAFEIALTSAVVIDVWQNSEGTVWTTTTIDGHSFAVLERMYVVSEVSWGLQSIVQVDLCGRSAADGASIVEHVSANEEEEDEI